MTTTCCAAGYIDDGLAHLMAAGNKWVHNEVLNEMLDITTGVCPTI